MDYEKLLKAFSKLSTNAKLTVIKETKGKKAPLYVLNHIIGELSDVIPQSTLDDFIKINPKLDW